MFLWTGSYKIVYVQTPTSEMKTVSSLGFVSQGSPLPTRKLLLYQVTPSDYFSDNIFITTPLGDQYHVVGFRTS